MQNLIGRRLRWTGWGFTLLVKDNQHLWRARSRDLAGVVESVEFDRFYQLKEKIAWLTVRLDRAHGAYKYALAFFDEETGELFHPAHEPTEWIE